MVMKNKWNLLLAAVIVFALSGCASLAGQGMGNSSTAVAATLTPQYPTMPAIVVGTAEPAGTIVAVPAETLPAGTPAPITFPAGGGLIVGLQDQGKTVVMHVGDRFLLQLGDVFLWTVTSSDDSVVGRVINVMVIKGAQGLYEGRKAGEATITAIGDPFCRSSSPPCMTPSISYTIHVQIEP